MDPLKPTQKWSNCSIQIQATLFQVGEDGGPDHFYSNAGHFYSVFPTTSTDAVPVWRSPTPPSYVSPCFAPGQTYIAVGRLSLPNPASLPFMFHRLYHQEFFFFFNVPLFGCVGSSCCAWALSSCGKQQYSPVAVCRLLTAVAPLTEVRTPWQGFSSCGTWAQLPQGLWNPPGPGIEPGSPALAGRFPTTGPQGRGYHQEFYLALLTLLGVCFLDTNTTNIVLGPTNTISTGNNKKQEVVRGGCGSRSQSWQGKPHSPVVFEV